MAFLGQMDTVESIGTRTEVPLLGLSMRDENRFEIRYRSRLVVDQDFRYDRDLLTVGWMGNGHPDLIGRPLSFRAWAWMLKLTSTTASAWGRWPRKTNSGWVGASTSSMG